MLHSPETPSPRRSTSNLAAGAASPHAPAPPAAAAPAPSPMVANGGSSTPRRGTRPVRAFTVGGGGEMPAAGTPAHRRSQSLGEEVRWAALRSTNANSLLPTTEPDVNTWHSVPLAFAVLPALGGVLFTNGNLFVTDVLVLFLAAVFLHWLVKFPWEWYHACQLVRPGPADVYADGTAPYPPSPEPSKSPPSKTSQQQPASASTPPSTDAATAQRAEAASRELKHNAILALLACFIGPAIGGFLLHTIRSQLSRPSEGLVSNFNLTIFILAAELRPTAHVVHLLRARSLYLQGVVIAPPKSRVDGLEARVLELSEDVRELTALTARAVERDPDLDALNRAVRRYEKKEALHSAQIETRIVEIDGRLNDVLTLAAAAAASAKQQPSFRGVLLEWVCACFIVPFSLVWKVLSFPARAVENVAATSGRLLLREQQRQRSQGRDGRVRGIKGKGPA